MQNKANNANTALLIYKNKTFLLKTTFFSKIIPSNNVCGQILKITCGVR